MPDMGTKLLRPRLLLHKAEAFEKALKKLKLRLQLRAFKKSKIRLRLQLRLRDLIKASASYPCLIIENANIMIH